MVEVHHLLQCMKLVLLAIALMLYELIFFVAFVSLSIGAGTCGKLALRVVFGIELHIALETFLSWYTLAMSTEFHLKLYRKCVYTRLRQQLRTHSSILQGFPRMVYFVLYCLAVYGIYYEYEAVHAYRPLRMHRIKMDVSRHGHGVVHRIQRRIKPTTNTEDFAPHAPNEKIHTACFLVMMSYVVYCSGQVLCLFILRIARNIPIHPILPQIYAMWSMLIMQAVVSVFYAFPLMMILIGCHMFRVDGISTYMFSLCLTLMMALAAAQLESESPFPTEAGVGPCYYFEAQYRARVNLIFMFLPLIAYYYFEQYKSYPLTAMDHNFIMFIFWFMMALLHTIKSLYLTTWRPLNADQVAPAQPPEQQYEFNPGPPDQPVHQPQNANEEGGIAIPDRNSNGPRPTLEEDERWAKVRHAQLTNNNEEDIGLGAHANHFEETWMQLEETGSSSNSNRKKVLPGNHYVEYESGILTKVKKEVVKCFEDVQVKEQMVEKVDGEVGWTTEDTETEVKSYANKTGLPDSEGNIERVGNENRET